MPMDDFERDRQPAEPEDWVEKAVRKKQNRGALLREWAVALALALAIAIFLTQVVFINAQIPSPSMEDTIMVGDRVLGFRFSYWFDDPQRGDIVIFKFPDDERELYVKRVIGLPGDTVEIRAGLVYLNGAAEPMAEPYLREPAVGDYGPYEVPEGYYFVMGDNRNSSYDSRFWQNTYVAREKVVGRAAVRILPNPGRLE